MLPMCVAHAPLWGTARKDGKCSDMEGVGGVDNTEEDAEKRKDPQLQQRQRPAVAVA